MKTKTVEEAKRTVWAKSKLTPLQYFGGPGMTPHDHSRVSEVMFEVFGNRGVDVPPVCTAQWGFEAWAKVVKPC